MNRKQQKIKEKNTSDALVKMRERREETEINKQKQKREI